MIMFQSEKIIKHVEYIEVILLNNLQYFDKIFKKILIHY